ncbi:MAG: fumarylacetoacetate hydrolase family protein [Hyphomicrobiales bacterium]|nr:fumarylacetoacetate hydrolase family protein [Hyphomicrobiales bacterium]
MRGTPSPEAEAIAGAFRRSRRAAAPLGEFPGTLPGSLREAYAVQDAAIAGWDDRVIGWKVAGIAPEWRQRLGAERLAGPVFARNLHDVRSGAALAFPVFEGGFAAVEAEFVIRIGRVIAPEEASDPARLRDAVAALHAGAELAGSPFAAINDLGPCAVISDFGNNNGLLLGPEIPGWAAMPLEGLVTRSFVNASLAGAGNAARLADGPLGALAFLVAHLATRGRGLGPGDLVSTGQTTGIHAVRAGDEIAFEFTPDLRFGAKAVAATAAAHPAIDGMTG